MREHEKGGRMGRKKIVRQHYVLWSNEGPIEVTEEIYYVYYGSRDQERELDKFFFAGAIQ